jgi:hypothetical protein
MPAIGGAPPANRKTVVGQWRAGKGRYENTDLGIWLFLGLGILLRTLSLPPALSVSFPVFSKSQLVKEAAEQRGERLLQ